MADFVAGTVAKVSEKPTANGGTVYNVCVDTEDNGEEWFGCGFDDPKLNEGDEIEFDIDYNGDYTNINQDTLVVVKEAPQRQSSSRGSRGNARSKPSSNSRSSRGNSNSSSRGRGDSRSKPNSGGRDSSRSKGKGRSESKSSGRTKTPAKQEVDWERKDNLIRLQSSQNTAIAFVNCGLANGCIVLPAAKAKKYDAFLALVEEEADRLFNKYSDIVDGCYDNGKDDAEEYDEDDVPE
jgi:hypothetical protein